jgi:hypothetical protein
MLTLVHATIGTLVIATNAIAALWLWLRTRWGMPLDSGALWALRLARGALALQVVLGVALIGGGAVGSTGHYLFALAALGASWYGFTASRRPGRLQRHAIALGCAATALLALGAYLLARG